MRIYVWLLLALAALGVSAQTDPWSSSDLMQPAALAARLNHSGPKPMILYVGFPVLYHPGHIPGAQLAGPASKAQGLEQLRDLVAKLPRDTEIVIYCGCCPWDHCPNVRPAFRALHDMGFSRVHVLTIPTNMTKDWIEKGYPIDRAVPRQ